MDLKSFYDRVQNAQAKKQRILNDMNTALALGTPEGDEAALSMEADLDAATAEEQKAVAFYNKVVNASKSQNVNELFVPAGDQTAADESQTNKEITRKEFNALAQSDRRKFIASGGVIKD